jgi:hypothetical protein
VAYTDDMVNIAEGKLQQFIGQDGPGICKTKKGMVGKNGPEPHGAGVQDTFMAEAAETGMAMHNLNLFSDHNVPEDGKEGKNRGHGRLSIDDEERNMINLETIGEIMHSSSSLICMRDDDDFVSSVNEFLIASQPLTRRM